MQSDILAISVPVSSSRITIICVEVQLNTSEYDPTITAWYHLTLISQMIQCRLLIDVICVSHVFPGDSSTVIV